MRDINPLILLGVGFVLLVIGWVLPVLMIMQILESTFLLNLIAYSTSFLGLMIGIVGSVMYLSRHRHK